MANRIDNRLAALERGRNLWQHYAHLDFRQWPDRALVSYLFGEDRWHPILGLDAVSDEELEQIIAEAEAEREALAREEGDRHAELQNR